MGVGIRSHSAAVRRAGRSECARRDALTFEFCRHVFQHGMRRGALVIDPRSGHMHTGDVGRWRMCNVCMCAYCALPSVVVVGQQPPRQGAPHHLHVLSDGVHLSHAHALHSDIERGHERLRASWRRHCQLCKQLQFANLVYVHEARLRGRHGVEHVLLADDGLPQQQTHLGPAEHTYKSRHIHTYMHSCEEGRITVMFRKRLSV